VGEGEDEARRLNEAYLKHRTTGLPFVIAKFAASLDGRIAAPSGESRWISGPEAREWAHGLRTKVDAILCGAGTIVIDDPELTARPGGQEAVRQPMRIVADSRGRTPAAARVLRGPGRTLVATTDRSHPVWRVAMEAAGLRCWSCLATAIRWTWKALLRALGQRRCCHCWWKEGVIIGALFDRGWLTRRVIIAPIDYQRLGRALAVASAGARRLKRRGACAIRAWTLGNVLITGYPEDRRGPSNLKAGAWAGKQYPRLQGGARNTPFVRAMLSGRQE
jgi:diaminohydroxyphosphoribosylaminopyrimidine deaminase/5-amino-6-(5-phosphoribosylamino)uracil reductase